MSGKQYSIKRLTRYLAIYSICLAFSVSAKAQSAGLHVYNGMIRVKMESEHILPTPLNRSSATRQAMPVRTGIARLDALNQQYSVSSYLRVFPHAGDFEDKHKQYGLHLWYDLFIDEYADPAAVAAEYGSVAGVLAAEPIYRTAQKEFIDGTIQQAASSIFNDPDYGKQWNFENDGTLVGAIADVDIDLAEAWKITTGNPNVIVCVIDDGVDFTHADLAANMWTNTAEIAGNGVDDDKNGFIDDIHGYNFVTKTSDLIAGDHGTLVAGIIAAVNNNGIGVSGIAGGSGSGNGVKIMSAQTFRGAASATAGPAYVYAADNGAVIAQSSWGYAVPGSQNQSDTDAINYFINEAGKDKNGNPRPNTPMVGGIAIFSAGNAGDNSLWYPAAADNVVAVAAVGISGTKPSYSNYGSWVDITAPGGNALNGMPTIYSTKINNGYGYNQGTSFACPHVSGVAALILSKYGHSGYTPDSLRVRLEATTTPLFDLEPNYAQYMGSGLLNAAKALQPFVPVTEIKLPYIIDLEIGEVYTPSGFILPANATDQRIKWSGNDATIVSVDNRGRFMGLKTGTSQITATSHDGRFSQTCTVRVNTVAIKRLDLSVESLNISIGGTYQLKATITPENAANPTIIWTSSNSSIVKVDSWGLVTAMKEGKATITATAVDGNITDQCIITVTPIVEGVAITPKNITLAVGQNHTFSANITPASAANKEVSWQSSDTNYVIVDGNGVATVVKAGRYNELINIKITAITKQGAYADDATVTIRQEMIIPEGFSPNGDGINDYLYIPGLQGDTYTLRIYDRSGQLCHEAISYQNNWDGIASIGTQKGKKVLPGTYYYVLSAQNSNEVKKGYIVIKH